MSDWTAWAFYPTALLTAFSLIVSARAELDLRNNYAVLMILNLHREQILFSSATWVEALAVVHVAHALFTFGALHWVKGSPDFSHISERHLTMWEQIEPGVNWKESPTKKWAYLSRK